MLDANYLNNLLYVKTPQFKQIYVIKQHSESSKQGWPMSSEQ
jgi:hypothetical protein